MTGPSAETSSAGGLTISHLSREFGVTPRALRFYEDQGLLTPHREGATRRYSDRDRERLSWIVRGKRVGFSIAEIRELIVLNEDGDGPRNDWAQTIARCRARIDQLTAQRVEIERTLMELGAAVALLEAGGP
ncbi:hypothetical protein BH10PSE13_BH10PSE13_21170 [soil metagenome]